MKVKETIELTRIGVTPAQFLGYVRYQIKKHKITSICPEDLNLRYWAKGGDIEFDYHDIPGKSAQAEKSVSRPYQMQTFIKHWNGDVYNEICEFDFWDEKTGTGYYYLLNECTVD